MKSRLFGTATIAALAFGLPAMAQAPIKIGFVSTFSGPQAAIGEDMRRSVELAKEHLGGKMGGKPFEIIYEDDQFKPDVGKQKSEKLVQQDKVNFVAGYIWSNVLLASLKTVTDEGDTILISSNAGPSQIAGELCNKNFFSTSWNNDQTPMAMGQYLQEKGVKSLYLMAGNYAAGKDMLAGVKRTFKGEIKGEDLTKWPDQLDFSAELAKVGAAKPDGIFIFYPGAHGVQFLQQYVQAGLKGKVPLYQVFSIDAITLPQQKELALGTLGRPGVGQRPAQRAEQEVRRRLQEEARRLSVLLRRAELRFDHADRLGRRGAEGRSVEQGQGPRRDEEGQLQVAARRLQVQHQPVPDPELLHPGSGQGSGRHDDGEDHRHRGEGRQGSVLREVPDEVTAARQRCCHPERSEGSLTHQKRSLDYASLRSG